MYKGFDKYQSVSYHSSAMKRIICLLVPLVFCLFPFEFSFVFAEANHHSYVWPIEKTKELSSMFADHRDFRFHSGIDIPTQKRTGYKVFACQSGYVYRLFTSWRGYGKAVYLKLDDGRFAVYGHLSGFSKKLSKFVTRRQLKTRRYRTDFLLKEKEIRVKRGELIGYSGESGWGGPHLHFELRDSSGCPINPLTSGFSVKDKVPPIMKYLVIRPLGIEARVNSSSEPALLPLFFDDHENIYRLEETPMAEGEIGLELSVHDKMNNSRFNFGIYRLELYLDDSLVFASRYDQFSFENTHKIELDRDFELWQKQGKKFYKLYLEEGNDLLIYDPPGGKINAKALKPGPHQVEIKAFDAFGNFSSLASSLIFDQRPLILSCSLTEENNKQKIKVRFDDPDDLVQEIIVEESSFNHISWEEVRRERIGESRGEHTVILREKLDKPVLFRMKMKDSFGAFSEQKFLVANADQLKRANKEDSLDLDFEYSFKDNFFIFDLKFSQILREAPRLSLKSGGFNFDPLFYEQLDERSYCVVFPFFLKNQREMSFLIDGVSLYGDKVTMKETIPIAIITKSFGGMSISSDGKAKIEFEPEMIYKDINVTIHAEKKKFEPKHKLAGKVYSFEPSTVPFNGRTRISLSYPEEGCDPYKLGLYELTREKSWRFVDQKLDTLNRLVEGEVRHLSVFALLEDTLPPKVSKVSISPGKRIKERKPRITTVVKDDLSDIGSDEDILVEIDGEWMIPEYDPEKKILSARPIVPLTLGKHLLTIQVKDRAGNETKIEREFFVIGK
ncbi:MAG: hypothetical protein AMJ91_05450 [candidate division Zixibacteria bacterium SM23_73_3]|nr:MAG: hypothetical protein AMJ91_05450 [candidate division Zixibacteria bacterium SM23_73_3]